LFLGLIVGVVLIILSASLLISHRLKPDSQSSQTFDRNLAKTSPSPSTDSQSSSLEQLRKNLGLGSEDLSGSSSSSGSDGQVSSGPNLKFKIVIQGRPDNDQNTKLIVNIASGQPTTDPQYLASFTVDVPASGEYDTISLVGLQSNTTYTAYLKGSAQIDAAIPFTVTPAGATLNNGDPIPLTSGDLNEDNIIDSADYNLLRAALGATPSSSNWNANFDLNLDNIINNLDLSIVSGNSAKIGASGKWYSKVDSSASSSASLVQPPNIGGLEVSSGTGHWVWLPY